MTTNLQQNTRQVHGKLFFRNIYASLISYSTNLEFSIYNFLQSNIILKIYKSFSSWRASQISNICDWILSFHSFAFSISLRYRFSYRLISLSNSALEARSSSSMAASRSLVPETAPSSSLLSTPPSSVVNRASSTSFSSCFLPH